MTGTLSLTCPECGIGVLADDQFCESCGLAIAGPRNVARHHIEIDCGAVAAVTDRGLVHALNEDAVSVETDGARVVVVVADGVSTSAAPEAASQAAVDAIGHRLWSALVAAGAADASGTDVSGTDAWEPLDAMAAAMVAGQQAVVEVPWLAVGGRDAPSCTVVAVIWDGRAVTLGWAGDSRAYWVDADGAQQLTVDHSWVQDQIDSGAMTAQAANRDGRAHGITRWLGQDQPPGPDALTGFRPARPGRLIVCSDGLWNYAPAPEELVALMAAAPRGAPAIDVARLLTRAALRGGGRDNVTVAIVDIVPGTPPWMEEPPNGLQR